MSRRKKPKIALPVYVRRVMSRGREYYYFHAKRGTESEGKAIRLPATPQDPEFWATYHQLLGQPVEQLRAGTFAALIDVYKASPEFRNLSEGSQKGYAIYLKVISDTWGELSVAGLEPKHVLKLRDRYADRPGGGNFLIRVLSALISWSVPRGYRRDNPCTHVRRLKIGDGFAPWSAEDIEYFRQHATPELWWAAALALYSGQRRNDVLKMKHSDIEDGMISVVQQKTGKRLWIPIHSDLQALLDSIPKRSIFILTSTRGQPWGQGFSASWQKQMAKPVMKDLKEKGLVFHGFRKSAVVRLLEAGCTDAEVSAVTGQTRDMVEHYARQVSQKRLATAAIHKWEDAER